MRYQRRIRIALLAGVVGMTACGHPGEGADPAATEALPRLQVTDVEGARASIDAYRGRIVVLNLWATWCGPCRRELPSLDRLSLRLDATRFVVAGVAVDSDRIAVREYLLQSAIRFPNFVAADRREIEVALATRTLPQTLIIAADGSLIDRIEGARSWDSAAAIARIEAAGPRGGVTRVAPPRTADERPPGGRRPVAG